MLTTGSYIIKIHIIGLTQQIAFKFRCQIILLYQFYK